MSSVRSEDAEVGSVNSFFFAQKLSNIEQTLSNYWAVMKLNLDLADFRYSHFEVDVLSKLESFKGRWTSFGNLSSERLKQLKKQALIESIGSSTRIEGSSLSNSQIKGLELPKGSSKPTFSSKDEEDAAWVPNGKGQQKIRPCG